MCRLNLCSYIWMPLAKRIQISENWSSELVGNYNTLSG